LNLPECPPGTWRLSYFIMSNCDSWGVSIDAQTLHIRAHGDGHVGHLIQFFLRDPDSFRSRNGVWDMQTDIPKRQIAAYVEELEAAVSGRKMVHLKTLKDF